MSIELNTKSMRLEFVLPGGLNKSGGMDEAREKITATAPWLRP